jgi:UDP-N-acetylmuramoylalanine--D-glutamate ligase
MLEVLDEVGRALIVIGEAAELIAAAAAEREPGYPVVRAASLEEAVERATAVAEPGDAVVLSPACSSYDMFNNFGERGMAFRRAAAAAGAQRLDSGDVD